MGKALILIGVLLIIAGLLVHFRISIPFLGKLPGDFAYKGEHVQVYFPLATSIILSIVLSLLFYLFFGRKT